MAGRGGSYVAALDLTQSAGALVWKYQISSLAIGDKFFGQCPIVIDQAGNMNIAFTTRYSGVSVLHPSQ